MSSPASIFPTSFDLGAALTLGLVGSLHCAGMCGPLALALPSTGRTVGGFLGGRVAYNLGRILTYCTLGVVFGFVGRTVLMAGFQRSISIALGAALFAGLFTSRRLALWQPVTSLVAQLKFHMAPLLRQRSPVASGALGVLNGFLPCGLVYVACAGAITTGGVASGALYMAVFGLGTVPMMLSIGLSGKLIPTSVRLQLRRGIPVSVFALGALLILRGMSLGIPYVSPDLSVNAAGCCHR